MHTSTRSATKGAEILSTVGAAFLGAGLALLLQRWLATAAVPLLLVGIAAHGYGMFARRRLESRAGVHFARWEQALYWGCWFALAAAAAGPLFFA